MKKFWKWMEDKDYALIYNYRTIDKKKGLICDLTVDWIKENITGKPCIYCGRIDVPMGCDRMDNSKGHTMSNVVPCCFDCNKTKMDRYTYNEMKMIGNILKVIYEQRGEEGVKEELKKS
jgi:hypothetical protein